MQFTNFLTALAIGACLVSDVAANPAAAAASAAADCAVQHKGTGIIHNGKGKGEGKKHHHHGKETSTSAAAVASSTSEASSTSTAGSTGISHSEGGSSNSALILNPANVQNASDTTGQTPASIAAGQAASLTDPANFINFCTGKTLTNGIQVPTGSCNGIVMGDIPAKANTVSTIIISPQPGQDLPPNQNITLQANLRNIIAGSFTNPTTTYYAAPQFLKNGLIVGHTHFTVQTLGANFIPQTALDPTTFVFFKGIDNAADAQGNVAITIPGGLPAGFYRVCTMASASNHQPVLSAIAQRGAQDDCTKFSVGQSSGKGASANANTTVSVGLRRRTIKA